MENFSEHLEELRSRILKSVVVFLISFCVCYVFSHKMFQIIAMPLISIWKSHHKFIYTGVTEAFMTHLKLAVFGGLIISIPYTFIQAWMFIAPGLYVHEKKLFRYLLFLTPILFILGAVFAYYCVMPVAYKFFLSFEITDSAIPIQAELRLEEYLSFVIHMILVFGVCFQTPILMLILTKAGLVSVGFLKSNWRMAILLISVFSAIMAPPDLFSMIFLIIPLITLYYLSLLLCSIGFSKDSNAGHSLDKK